MTSTQKNLPILSTNLRLAAVIALAIQIIGGCGGSTSSLDANEIADAMAIGIAEVASVVYIDENNDPNDLIGRPDGYQSAAVLQDIRYYRPGDELGVANGATIEVLVTEDIAKNRIDLVTSAGQYAERYGKVILRAERVMKPSEFEVYRDRFLDFVKSGKSAESVQRSTANELTQPTTAPIVVNGYLVGPGVNLSGADLSYQNLDGVDFTGADLTNAKLQFSSLVGSIFTGILAAGANFNGSNLQGAIFRDATLSNASFTLGMKSSGGKLYRTTLDNTDFSNALIEGANFGGATISNAKFVNVKARKSDFPGVRMRNSDLSNGDFRNSVFSCCYVAPASTIPRLVESFVFLVADLTGSNLTGADFTGATMTNVVMPDGKKSP